MTDNLDKWLETVAYPLHRAIDEASTLDNADRSIDERWAHVVSLCPWLIERCQPALPGADDIFPSTGQWEPLKSSNLDAMKVDCLDSIADGAKGAATYELHVRFKNGTVYRYLAVTETDISGLRASASPGGYFSTWIKPRYASEKVSG